MSYTIDSWEGCYPSNWKGLIVPDAYTHPAKFSSKLIRRIYEHMVAEGWVRPGDVVVDPFGGVALGALDAMRLGLSWRGSELESHFVRLGQGMDCQGIDRAFWRRYQGRGRLWVRLEVCPECARLLDDPGPASEFMGTVSRRVPVRDSHRYRGNIETWQASGLAGDAALLQGDSRFLASTLLRPGSGAGVVSSPPFLQATGGTPEPKPGGPIDERLYARHRAGNGAAHGYGESAANLGNLRSQPGGFEAAVSSPPYQTESDGGGLNVDKPATFRGVLKSGTLSMGDSDGQLGASDDFWLAARAIVEQVYQVLAPGAHAVWVVKDFVKNKERVPFSDQWRELCEAVGFVTLHEHRAMLVHRRGTQHALDGSVLEIKSESKSFFRRLAEKNGSPRIDWETVWCMVKPG